MADSLLEAKFPFLREDLFLVAQVEVESGKQTLRMQKIDPATEKILLEDALDCIHAAICDIPASQFEEVTRQDDFEKKILQIRTSEQLREINLTSEEKFIAFRSWVAGIAEAGMNAFEIQGEIDAAAHLQYPVTNRLLRFLARVDAKFTATYLNYVDRAASHEGIRHRAYLVASLLPILEGLITEPKIPDGDQVLQMVFSLDPPFELFNNNWPLFRKLAAIYPGFLSQYLTRVQEVYLKNMGGGEEWLSVVLCPVFDCLLWAGDSTRKQRQKIWNQIRNLDPPAELYLAYKALFRYFALEDLDFVPQYMRKIKRERTGKRLTDDKWLIAVLHPVFELLDLMEDPINAGGGDLLEDILALKPPLAFLIENRRIIEKMAIPKPGIFSG